MSDYTQRLTDPAAIAAHIAAHQTPANNQVGGIIDTLTDNSFAERMSAIRPDNFSDTGLYALFDHLDDMSVSLGQPIQFDPIAICCEFTEYTGCELVDAYKHLVDRSSEADDDEYLESVAEFIGEQTTVLHLDNGHYIVAEF